MLRYFQSQIYLAHYVSVVLIRVVLIQLCRAVFVLVDRTALLDIHHWNSSLFQLALQYGCHLLFVFRTSVCLVSCFTIHLEVVHQLWLHLLLTLLFVFTLNYFILDIIHNYLPFETHSLLPLVLWFKFLWLNLLSEIVINIIWFYQRHCLAVLVGLADVVFVLSFLLIVVDSGELLSHVV